MPLTEDELETRLRRTLHTVAESATYLRTAVVDSTRRQATGARRSCGARPSIPSW
jgi:hypothetical protein